jgi:hypothetical protein
MPLMGGSVLHLSARSELEPTLSGGSSLVFSRLSVLSFFISLVFGLMLLNALPGAAQRVPVDRPTKEADVFSIANKRRTDRFFVATSRAGPSTRCRAGSAFGS